VNDGALELADVGPEAIPRVLERKSRSHETGFAAVARAGAELAGIVQV